MTVTTGVPTLVPGRTGAFIPFVVGAVLGFGLEDQ